ncbi:MAG: hypothetical protein AAFX85_14200, partial [Pseudomonadota bacterium]
MDGNRERETAQQPAGLEAPPESAPDRDLRSPQLTRAGTDVAAPADASLSLVRVLGVGDHGEVLVSGAEGTLPARSALVLGAPIAGDCIGRVAVVSCLNG